MSMSGRLGATPSLVKLSQSLGSLALQTNLALATFLEARLGQCQRQWAGEQ